MPVAGIAILIYSIYIVLNRRRVNIILIELFALNLCYEGFINVGYFVSIGGQIFKVPDYLQFLMVIFSLMILMKQQHGLKLAAFIFLLGLSVVWLIVDPFGELVKTFNGVDFVNNLEYMHYPSFDLQTIKTTTRLICFAVNAMAVAVCIDGETWEQIKERYFKLGRIVISYAWCEFILKNILHVSFTENLIRVLFGSDTSIMTNLNRNGLSVIIGFNNEPSQFAMMLFSYWILYILSKEWLKQSRVERNITISSLLLMILCGSFRPVGMYPILILLYLIVTEKPSKAIVIFGVVAIGIGILSMTGMTDYYLGRLTRAFDFLKTGDNTIAGGEAGRLSTIVEAFKVFLKRPLFGIGPGQTFAYGFIPSMLVMTGAAGTISWYNLMFCGIGELFTNVKSQKWFWILLVISFAWIYTDSIAIGYSIYVLGIAFVFKFREREEEGCRIGSEDQYE